MRMRMRMRMRSPTAFTAWAADHAAGKDALMLAPTRELVAELNTRARTDRLAATGKRVGREQGDQ